MKFLKIGVVCSLALTGCVSHYAVPSGAKTATIRLAASISDYPGSWALVQNFATESCAENPNGTRLAAFTTQGLQGKGDPHSGVDIQIVAGQPFVFSYVFQRGTAPFTDTVNCTLTESFTPAPGATYKSLFEVIDGKCRISVNRIEGNMLTSVDGLRRVEPACANQISG